MYIVRVPFCIVCSYSFLHSCVQYLVDNPYSANIWVLNLQTYRYEEVTQHLKQLKHFKNIDKFVDHDEAIIVKS